MTSTVPSDLQALDIEASPAEKLVILKLRQIRYGKVVIVMRDGQPQYLESTVETIRLD